MRIPNFFIVGAPKCGTTAMNHYLSQHPEIFVSEKKELHFFGADLKFESTKIAEERYLSHFSETKDEKRIGEASVWYLYSKEAAAEIKQFAPSADIIIMLRNPVDMLYSLHSRFLYNSNEDITEFTDALDAEEDRKLGLHIPDGVHFIAGLYYRETVKYAEQVKRYFNIFGRDRVHVIIFDDFENDTSEVYRETLQFLGVDTSFQPVIEVINSNKRVFSATLQRTLRRPPKFAIQLGKVLPRQLRQRLLRDLKHVNVRPQVRPPLNTDLRNRLQVQFVPEVESLSQLIDRDLTHWSKT